jgi:hypothetical protein
MSEVRILHDEGLTRFVELSQFFDTYSSIPVLQTVARLQHDYDEQGRFIMLQRPDEDSSRIKTFALSFEEMDTLIMAYQAFLADHEAKFSPSTATVPLDDGGDGLPFTDDRPF